MTEAYPYTISNNKVEPFLAKVRSAAKPDRFTLQLLKNMGFTASNDRALLRILKELDFLDDNGTPTEAYDRLRDPTDWQHVLGERIKARYSDLYGLHTDIHDASDDEVKGAISRVTGKDGKTVSRYFATFKALTALAKFETKAAPKQKVEQQDPRKMSSLLHH